MNANTALLATAVSSLSAALSSGVKAEGAIVTSVKAISFLALDKIGREMHEEGFDIKTTRAFSDPYTMVLKRLVNSGLRVFRDSEDSFAEHVKGKSSEDRVKGVNAYIKANKGKDLVWTVGQVRSIARKIISAVVATEDGKEFCRALSRVEDTAAQVQKFEDFFHAEFGTTYKEVSGAFVKPAQPADASKSILNAIAKMDDLVLLEKIAAELAARIEAVRLNAAKMNAIAPVVAEDEGMFDNVVQLAA